MLAVTRSECVSCSRRCPIWWRHRAVLADLSIAHTSTRRALYSKSSRPPAAAIPTCSPPSSAIPTPGSTTGAESLGALNRVSLPPAPAAAADDAGVAGAAAGRAIDAAAGPRRMHSAPRPPARALRVLRTNRGPRRATPGRQARRSRRFRQTKLPLFQQPVAILKIVLAASGPRTRPKRGRRLSGASRFDYAERSRLAAGARRVSPTKEPI